MITLHTWYPMLGVADYPSKADVSERRAQRLQEEYDTALNLKKPKTKWMSLK